MNLKLGRTNCAPLKVLLFLFSYVNMNSCFFFLNWAVNSLGLKDEIFIVLCVCYVVSGSSHNSSKD